MGNWILILSIAGYPILSFAPSILKLDSTPLSIALRSLILLLAILVSFFSLFKRFHKRKTILQNSAFLAVLFFWMVYSVRLYYDLSIDHIPLYEDHKPFYFYSYAFGSCLIPAIAIWFTADLINLKYVYKWMYWLLYLFGFLTILFLILGSEITYYVNGRLFANQNLNPISTGHAGVTLAIISLWKIILDNKSFFDKVINYLGLGIGWIIIFLSVSRSPMIVAILCSIIILIFILLRYASSLFTVKHLVMIGLIVAMGISFYIIPKIENNKLQIASRIVNTGGENEIRSTSWETAWQQFLGDPVIGDQFLERSFGMYPHNILLEVPMATGIIGSLPFLFFLSVSFYRSFILSLKFNFLVLFFAIFMQYFLWNLTSGSLFGSGALWILLIYYISVRPYEKKY